jgi:methionyl-tRNA synthetase
MPDPSNKFYLTTPIYYVNARPHIGHAYSTIAADVIARRHRLLGDDTYFLTGTDEHGQKVQRSAAAAGIPPQQFADEVSATFSALWKRMGITNDDFIRTTDPRHKRGVQKLWRDLEARGAIYLSTYTGQYSVGEEMFVDGPPGTIGPDGKPTETVTEENYFFKLSEYQDRIIALIESGELRIQPEAIKNEVLSFVRGNVAEAISAAISEGKTRPVAPDEAISNPLVEAGIIKLSALGNFYVPGALKDLSISRTTFDWGIPVPGNEKHVVYVWLDALANYMTAVGYGSDDPADIAKFNRYWPADLHLVGKEITRFHCVYWPAFLLAAGLPLPKAVVANGWLLFEESKMSKSRGNVVRTETVLDAFGALCPPSPTVPSDGSEPQVLRLRSRSAQDDNVVGGANTPADVVGGSNTSTEVVGNATPSTDIVILSEGASAPQSKDLRSSDAPQTPSKAQQDLFASDVIRYFLLREIPFGQDGSFSFDAMITRYNADLANGYGNLVSRTLSMIGKYREGAIPPHSVTEPTDQLPIELQANMATAAVSLDNATKFEGFLDFSRALAFVWQLIASVDGLVSTKAPWKLAKSNDPSDQAELSDVLYIAAEYVRFITALLYPILPYATASVWRQLGLGSIEEAAASGDLKDQWGGLQPGTRLGPLAPIFPRADKGLAQIMNDMEAANAKPATTESVQSASSVLSLSSAETTAPDAGPRTATFVEENPGAKVAGSHALTTGPTATPPIEGQTSGALGAAASSKLTADSSGIASASSQAPTIGIDDFAKIDLRVAQIVVAERIPKADKLLRLEVDLGYERRQILSGIAEWYTPEELIGRRIAIIANLAPRKMRGLESHGMLLAASGEDHASKPILASFSDEIALGSKIR